MNKIDIENRYFYEYGKPELKKRTKNRLTQISEMGMEEVGVSQFGIREIMSGLYIENVWSYSDKDWNDYIEWVVGLINKKQNNKRDEN